MHVRDREKSRITVSVMATLLLGITHETCHTHSEAITVEVWQRWWEKNKDKDLSDLMLVHPSLCVDLYAVLGFASPVLTSATRFPRVLRLRSTLG